MTTIGMALIPKTITGASGSFAMRTPPLDHEIVDNPMKNQSIIEALFTQFNHVGNRVWCLVFE